MNSLTPGVYREQALISSITEFFNHPENLNKLLPVIEGKDISLRIIDWYVTSYTKNNRTRVDLTSESDNQTGIFDIWSEYKSQLKSYKKEAFDPFCRLDPKKKTGITKKLIDFEYSEGNTIPTTIGQLNFFRWLISSGILDYIKTNQTKIEHLMLEETIKKKKLKVTPKTVKGARKAKVQVKAQGVKESIDIGLEDQSTPKQNKIVMTFN